MRAEVRCCCDPGLLLGTVEVPTDHLSEGQTFRFFVQPAVSLLAVWEQSDERLFKTEPGGWIELPVARVQGVVFGTGEYLHGLAIKSNDTPIEQLRRIRGFQEAKR